MTEPRDDQNELTNRMVSRHYRLHDSGSTNIYTHMAALADEVRQYDAEHPSHEPYPWLVELVRFVLEAAEQGTPTMSMRAKVLLRPVPTPVLLAAGVKR